jgi:thiamine pyrophosphate-dependent acetolactate synthase large subunit-like protein
MRNRHDDTAWIAPFIVTTLRWSATPLTRDRLTDQVLEQAAHAHALHWQRTTAARRVREALEALLDGEQPVISAGRGYVLAAHAALEIRERAAQLAERAGIRLLQKARKIRAASPPHEAVQGSLAEVPGFEARP